MTRQISHQHQVASLPESLVNCVFGVQPFVVLLALICLTNCFAPSGLADERPEIFGADPMDYEEAGQQNLVLHFPWKFRLPPVARYRHLPKRMLLEPMLQEAEFSQRLPGQFIETWIKCFEESNDLEIRVVALEHLARIARLKNTDLSPVADQLIETLQQPTDRQLFWGSLCAIRDGNLQQAADVLLDLAKDSNDDTLRIVDPLLASWSYEPAIAVWQSRLKDSTTTATNRLMACDALAATGAQQATGAISDIVADTSSPFRLRRAAAVALCKLDSEAARNLAGNNEPPSLRQKLILVELLNQDHDDAMQTIMPFCDDQNSAVALAAWEAVQIHDGKRLLSKLTGGLKHKESGIRLCCTRLVAEFPNEERLQALMPLLADPHIRVRNGCRAALSKIASISPELEQPIVDFLAQQMNAQKTTWESIEQTCYALGELKRPEFAEACLKQCRHERQEVYIAAAWLYHLMPEPKLKKELKDVLDERLKRLLSGDYPAEHSDLDRQIGFLFQAGGYCQQSELLNTMVKQLNKASGLGEHGRAAGVWGIGALKADSKDAKLSAHVIDTMNDRVSPLEPEFDSVRRMAAQAIGRIAAESSIPVLQAAFPEDSATTKIPQTVRWALQVMGEASPGDIETFEEPVSGWRLQPITSSR